MQTRVTYSGGLGWWIRDAQGTTVAFVDFSSGQALLGKIRQVVEDHYNRKVA